MGYPKGMSTFDPQMEPPGDWQVPESPPQAPIPTRGSLRAAVFVWLVAGTGLVMSGCCLINAVVMGFQTDMLLEQISKDLPPELQSMDMEVMLQGMAVVMAIIATVMILLPAVVLAVLGFYVRLGKPGAINTAIGLVGLYAVLAGAGVLLTLIGVVTNGQVLTAVLPVLLLGGWGALSTVAMISLIAAKKQTPDLYAAPTWQG